MTDTCGDVTEGFILPQYYWTPNQGVWNLEDDFLCLQAFNSLFLIQFSPDIKR